MQALFFVILISTNCFGHFFGEQTDLKFPGKLGLIISGDWNLKETIISPALTHVSAIRES